MKNIRHLIWDLDGTIFDTYPAMTNALLLATKDNNINLSYNKILSLMKINSNHFLKDIESRFKFNKKKLSSDYKRHLKMQPISEMYPFEDIENVCKLIQSRHGKNLIITHNNIKTTKMLLLEFNMENLFSDIITAEEGYPRKPDPTCFHEMMKRNNISPDETLSIGDRELDIIAGKAAGTKTCLFSPDNHIIKTKTDITVKNYKDLYDIIY